MTQVYANHTVDVISYDDTVSPQKMNLDRRDAKNRRRHKIQNDFDDLEDVAADNFNMDAQAAVRNEQFPGRSANCNNQSEVLGQETQA